MQVEQLALTPSYRAISDVLANTILLWLEWTVTQTQLNVYLYKLCKNMTIFKHCQLSSYWKFLFSFIQFVQNHPNLEKICKYRNINERKIYGPIFLYLLLHKDTVFSYSVGYMFLYTYIFTLVTFILFSNTKKRFPFFTYIMKITLKYST